MFTVFVTYLSEFKCFGTLSGSVLQWRKEILFSYQTCFQVLKRVRRWLPFNVIAIN